MCAVLLVAYAALAQDFKLGSKIDDFAIQDLSGRPQTFFPAQRRSYGDCVYLCPCPVSNVYTTG
jgi:hypothetical protein